MRFVGQPRDMLGELFAVDNEGITVGKDGGESRYVLVRARWTSVHAMDVAHMGHDYDVRPGEALTPEKITRLAAVSRFPQGLSGELLDRVLKALQQDSLITSPTPEENLAALIDTARAATIVFEDRAAAMQAGYRRLGTDFPSMGEHWILPAALLGGHIDPRKPTMLTYAVINGKPTLLGLGFIATTTDDSQLGALPGGMKYWHEHSGVLAEESGARFDDRSSVGGVRSSGALRRTEDKGPSTRIWVLHAWTRLANPAGMYEAENWALPFARAGVSVDAIDANAARAMSLAVGGDAYLRDLLGVAGFRTADNSPRVDSVIAAARDNVSRLTRTTPATRMTRAEIEQLTTVWSELEQSLVAVAGPRVAELLRDTVVHRHVDMGTHE